MEKQKATDSVVVPIGEFTFSKVLKSKLYFFPKPKKPNNSLKYMFFYRVKPVQTITHYAKIQELIVDADKMIDVIEKMKSFKDPSKSASAYKFLKIVKLKTEIPFDNLGSSIQGKINGIFEDIIKLKSTKGLFKTK
jgi:hypothetical protein